MLPTTIGKYEVAHLLGEGAMGEVFLARDPFIGRSVAVKLMKTTSADDRERFQQEARTVGALSHPNIVVLHDFGFLAAPPEIDSGSAAERGAPAPGTSGHVTPGIEAPRRTERPYLVMEFVPGRNLEDWLRDPHTLDEHLRIIEGLCRALVYAHERGVLHRDLKPSNVQVMPDGECKLMDFGIARTGTGQLTTAHTVLGTPSYIAPEILEEAAYSSTGDVYSAGVVVYEMLAGINPFAGKTVASTLHNVLNRQPPHLIEQRPSLPSDLCHAVMACLARDPGHRPRDVSRLLEVVRRVRTAAPDQIGRTLSPRVQATASLRLRPLRLARRRLWATSGVALAVVLGAVLTSSMARDDVAPPEPALSPAPPAVDARARPVLVVPDSPAPVRASPLSRPPPASRLGVTVAGARPTPPLPTPLHVPASIVPAPPTPAPPLPSPTPAAAPLAPPALLPPATPPPPPPAALRALSPRRAGRRETVNLEIHGSGLRIDHRVRVMRGQREAQGIHVVREEIVDHALVRVTLLVDEDVPPGLYSVVLVDAQARTTNSLSLEVTL